jgi:molecular chaperone GrpE
MKKSKEKVKIDIETPKDDLTDNDYNAEPVETEEEPEAEIIEKAEPSPEQKYNELLDRYQRSLAEFDNFRKRTNKEKSVRYDDGMRDTVEKLLPVIDNFERAMVSVENKEDKFYQGVVMIARQLDSLLSDLGIETIESEQGTVFNHNLHYAVAHVKDEQYGDNAIIDVLQKGYKHKDKIIRPSMVRVAN